MSVALPTVLRVALPVPLPRLFDYLPPSGPPPGADWIGRRVRVPFGRGEQVGVVLEIGPAEAAQDTLKTVTTLLDDAPLLPGELLETLRFCIRYYHAPPGEVMATALPVVLRPDDPRRSSRAMRLWSVRAAATRRVVHTPRSARAGRDRLEYQP